MKKVLRKILIVTLIIISIINFISTNHVFAVEIDAEDVIDSFTNIVGGIVSIILWPKRITVTAIAFIANSISTTIATMDGTTGSIGFLTPFHIFFNKCKILDVNFFDLNSVPSGSATHIVRSAVAEWYYKMRILALVILLVILIYVGIRMALASVAEEKAKYKKMLFDWVCSLCLVFVLHYIAIFVIQLNSAIIRALEEIASQTSISNVMGDIGWNAILDVGIDSITSVLVYAILVFQIIGYVIAYFNRMLKIGFLLIISPLITITYSIDKMGDGKSQALNNWLKEFIYTILIQPFHCIIYITFVSIAFKLLVLEVDESLLQDALVRTTQYNQLANGVLAIMCIKFIKEAEGMVRKIFNFKDDGNGVSLAAGLMVTSAALSKANNLGKGARKFVNNAKDSNIFKAVSKDVKGSKLFGKASEKLSNLKSKSSEKLDKVKGKAAEKAGKIKDKIGKTGFGKKFGKTITGFKKDLARGKKFWNSKPVKFLRRHNSLASAIGIAAGAARYAMGNSNALDAIGAGNAAYQSADAFLTSSARTTGNNIAELIEKRNESLSQELEEAKENLDKSKNDLEDVENDLEEIDNELEEVDNELEEVNNELGEEETSGSEDDGAEDNSEENSDESSEDEPEPDERKQSLLDRKTQLLSRREELLSQKEESTSRKETLETDIRVKEYEISAMESDLNCANDIESMEGYQSRIFERGEAGDFNKSKNKDYERILNDLEIALSKVGLDNSFDLLKRDMERFISASPKQFNLEESLIRTLGTDITQNENYGEIFKAAKNLANFEYEAKMYENLKFSTDMNVTPENIARKTFESMNQ